MNDLYQKVWDGYFLTKVKNMHKNTSIFIKMLKIKRNHFQQICQMVVKGKCKMKGK